VTERLIFPKMSASIAAINVEVIITQLINTKLRFDSSLHVYVNTNLDKPRGKCEWIATKLFTRTIWTFLLYRLCYLFSNWKRNKDMVELSVQLIIFCAITVMAACMNTFEKSYIKFAFVMNQCWKKLGVKTGKIFLLPV